jgi:hypothetical protein
MEGDGRITKGRVVRIHGFVDHLWIVESTQVMCTFKNLGRTLRTSWHPQGASDLINTIQQYLEIQI